MNIIRFPKRYFNHIGALKWLPTEGLDFVANGKQGVDEEYEKMILTAIRDEREFRHKQAFRQLLFRVNGNRNMGLPDLKLVASENTNE